MALDWQLEADHLLVARVKGLLGFDEFKATQDSNGLPFSTQKILKILVLAEEFQGWQDGAWEQVGFNEQVDANISKMAVVIPERWQDELSLFLAKDLRDFPIRFFVPEQQNQARQWLQQRD